MWNLLHGNFALAYELNWLGFLAVFIFIRRLIVLNLNIKLINFIDGHLVNYILITIFFIMYLYNFIGIFLNHH